MLSDHLWRVKRASGWLLFRLDASSSESLISFSTHSAKQPVTAYGPLTIPVFYFPRFDRAVQD